MPNKRPKITKVKPITKKEPFPDKVRREQARYVQEQKNRERKPGFFKIPEETKPYTKSSLKVKAKMMAASEPAQTAKRVGKKVYKAATKNSNQIRKDFEPKIKQAAKSSKKKILEMRAANLAKGRKDVS